MTVDKEIVMTEIEPYDNCNRYDFCPIVHREECNYYCDFKLDFDTSDDKDSDNKDDTKGDLTITTDQSWQMVAETQMLKLVTLGIFENEI